MITESLNAVTLKVYNEIMGAHFRFDMNHVGVPDEAYMGMAKAAVAVMDRKSASSSADNGVAAPSLSTSTLIDSLKDFSSNLRGGENRYQEAFRRNGSILGY